MILESKLLMYPHEFIARTEDGDMTYYIRHLDPAEGSEQTTDEVEVSEFIFDRFIRMAQAESMRTIADALDPWHEVPAGEYPPIASRLDDLIKLLEHAFTGGHDVELTTKKESKPS